MLEEKKSNAPEYLKIEIDFEPVQRAYQAKRGGILELYEYFRTIISIRETYAR